MKINWPYRRDPRPTVPASLGEHTDREYAKIEQALMLLNERINKLVEANSLTEG